MNQSGKPDSTPQSQKFKEAARELGCDDSEEAFDEALKKVARHKPKDDRHDAKPSGRASKRPKKES